MKANIQKRLIFQSLKKVLKAKKITYKNLADSLELAESTLKRIFAIEDCSIEKLMKICDIIDISFLDLAKLAESSTVNYYVLPDNIDKFFSDNINYFMFYQELLDNKNIADIATDHELDQISVRKYLKKLEELELIECHPNDKIKFMYSGVLDLRKDSLLAENLLKNDLPILLDNIITNRKDGKTYLSTFEFKLNNNSKKKLIDELDQLQTKYIEIASLEEKVEPTEVETLKAVFGIGQGDLYTDRAIPRVD